MQEHIPVQKMKILNEAVEEAMMENVPGHSIQKLISYYGTNTACDRISIFEIRNHSVVDNTFEWCNQDVESRIRLLQNVPISRIAKDWTSALYARSTVEIPDLETYRMVNGENYEYLKRQGIRRLIAMPLFADGHFQGFIEMDNPSQDEMETEGMTLRLLADFASSLICRRDADARLRYLTEKDALTGLDNITTFRQRVEKILEQNWKDPSDSRIIYFNASNFKEFNALYGPSEGDKCLIRIANLVRETFETDVACRNYSDHFYVFYEGQDAEEKIQTFHDRCLELRKHFKVWMRAGICRTQEVNSVFSACDAAKLACDQLPDDTVSFCNTYSEEIVQSLRQEKYIQDNAENAVRSGRILIYFQPVVRTRTGKLCSFEALARWADPIYGFLSPGVFIPVLEKHHRCYKIDTYVVEECCRLLAERREAGLPCVPVSFNISRTDFLMCDPVAIVTEAAERYGIDHRYLCVEITESSVMESPEKTRDAIHRFKEAGFQVWMDDFGSAYSSLNTLTDYDFDEIKLDMAFMRNLNDNSKIIVTSAVHMAQKLGIHTLCEGVETKEQLDFLKEIGCEKIQGYYYGRPMPLEEQIKNLREKGVEPEN